MFYAEIIYIGGYEDQMTWVKQHKRGLVVYRPYRWYDYLARLLGFLIAATMAFARLDSHFFIGICVISPALVLLLIMKPTAFYINSRKGLVIDDFFKRYPISALEIMEREAYIQHVRIDLSHLSDDEMAYIKEKLGTDPIKN